MDGVFIDINIYPQGIHNLDKALQLLVVSMTMGRWAVDWTVCNSNPFLRPPRSTVECKGERHWDRDNFDSNLLYQEVIMYHQHVS